MTRVIVNGAKGKMGAMTVQFVQADPELTLVGETDRGDNLLDEIRRTKAQVVVDFTNASVGYDNFLTILEGGAHPVVGTSGFNKEQVATLGAICREKKIGALIAPNFAIGAVLMMKFAKEAAKYMPHVEIVEGHHEQKLDAPSGTAIRTAELIREGMGEVEPAPERGEELIRGSRGGRASGIPVHAIRLPGIVAQERVIFGDVGQTLVLEHTSINRECFMSGVCIAAKKIVGTTDLLYGLEELIFRD